MSTSFRAPRRVTPWCAKLWFLLTTASPSRPSQGQKFVYRHYDDRRGYAQHPEIGGTPKLMETLSDNVYPRIVEWHSSDWPSSSPGARTSSLELGRRKISRSDEALENPSTRGRNLREETRPADSRRVEMGVRSVVFLHILEQRNRSHGLGSVGLLDLDPPF